MNGNVK